MEAGSAVCRPPVCGRVSVFSPPTGASFSRSELAFAASAPHRCQTSNHLRGGPHIGTHDGGDAWRIAGIADPAWCAGTAFAAAWLARIPRAVEMVLAHPSREAADFAADTKRLVGLDLGFGFWLGLAGSGSYQPGADRASLKGRMEPWPSPPPVRAAAIDRYIDGATDK